ncbi:MAG TPA: ABC transporter permease DevC [Opitutus sp.]|nr:ABC transporter permease DevC [Opitutus sp.]
MKRTAVTLWSRWFPLGRPFAWLQLRSDRRRFAAAVAGIAFAVIMMMFQLGLREALLKGAVVVHRHLRADLAMISPQYDFIAANEGFTERRLEQARALEEVAGVARLEAATGHWRNPVSGKLQEILVLGFRPGERPFDLPGLVAEEGMVERRGTVLFDRLARPSYGPVERRLAEGGAFETEVNRHRVRVEGLFELGTTLAVDATLAVSEQTFHDLFPTNAGGSISVGLIRLRPGADAAAVRDRLRALLPGDVRVLTMKEFIAAETDYWADRTPIGFVITASIFVGLIVGAVIVYQILYTDVTEHLPEYATLKAIGYDERFFQRMVLGQSLILTVAGYLPGVALSAIFYRVMAMATNLAPRVSVLNLALVFGLTATMCMAAGAFAIRRLERARPAEIF